MSARCFVMAGGGTGGHVIPAIAVARELRKRGHESLFIGTHHGMESRLVPTAGFPIEWIEIGGFNRVGLKQRLRTMVQLPISVLRAATLLKQHKAAAVFSMGGYVAGPVMIAARYLKIPTVLMEPNVIPGMTNRRMAKYVTRALLSFEQAMHYFPAGCAEITGLPVRTEFFALPEKPREETLNVLITGGSRGSRTLNLAAQAMWPKLAASRLNVRLIHQCGSEMIGTLSVGFQSTGLKGEVRIFIDDMPAAFAAADLVVCRSGAGAVSELAAAGKPSILVPFPFAADDHQLKNAEAMQHSGAARLVKDAEMTGERLFAEIKSMAENPAALHTMGKAARSHAHPGAATRAADILLSLAGEGLAKG